MFERFTERARQVVVLAQQAAHDFENEEIDLVHLWLGLYDEEDGAAAQVLRHVGVTGDALRDLVRFGTAGKHHGQQLPFTENARKALELSLREALALGHNYIGTEHILLGLLRTNSLLIAPLVAPTHLQTEMMRYLSGPKAAQAPPKNALTVSFEIEEGQVWVDPDNVSWYVKLIDGRTIHLERVAVESVNADVFVKTWRKVANG